ncbi:Hsp20/alpha crystallin family protein [Patescibacteria group bacterium]|nr:Hsp20/alpha crystallin family protein [Patescibacteria group bacterium]
MAKKPNIPKTDAEKLKDLNPVKSRKAGAAKPQFNGVNLEELEDVPLLGGLFKGLGKLVDLAKKVEESGGKIERKGEIKGLTEKHPRAVWGFSMSTLSKGKEKSWKVEPFGNIKKTEKGAEITEEREPMVDVFDEKDEILVIAELPGVDEKEIKLDLKGDILLLEASDEERKYKKEILLPAKVEMENKKMSFKNGILEIKFKKK